MGIMQRMESTEIVCGRYFGLLGLITNWRELLQKQETETEYPIRNFLSALLQKLNAPLSDLCIDKDTVQLHSYLYFNPPGTWTGLAKSSMMNTT